MSTTDLTSRLSPAEQLKFGLLAEGVTITPAARDLIDDRNEHRALTPADYASTSGVILVLEEDVWVNAPTIEHNPNFVAEAAYRLDLDADGHLVVRGRDLEAKARFWLPPLYHDLVNDQGEAYTSYAFTHTDRVRISPVEGCSMTCKFCDLPYEFRYRTKRIEGLVDSVRMALEDPIQPASHVLISGGTPRDRDIGYVRDAYEAVITSFPDTPVDVMMVPIDELMDVRWLGEIGVHELSINVEIFNTTLARSLMRRKADQGLDHYLSFLHQSADILGPGRVRSMLMVGLEPVEDTLAGVRAIAERGCVPVLSPFRPDQATPLRDRTPPDAELLAEVYLRAHEVAHEAGSHLGPSCIPCSHNTLTLAATGAGDADRHYGATHLI